MKRSILLISCLLVFVLGCNLFSNANALTFDIGNKVEESDVDRNGYTWYYFDSGTTLWVKNQIQKDYAPLLFDNDVNTSIDHDFGVNNDYMDIRIYFPYLLYINNITVKPNFNGSATKYILESSIVSGTIHWTQYTNTEKTFQINNKMQAIRLLLNSEGSNHFYFNEVVINYTINLTDLNSVNQALSMLQNSIDSLQNQINNINTEITNLNNYFNKLNSTVTDFNKTINNINQTQQQINNEITNLWVFYNELNDSIKDLKQDIISINSSLNQNITQIENNLIAIKNDITKIEKIVNNVTIDADDITALRELINITKLDIINLNTNLTQLYGSIPEAYDDSEILSRILTLENENADLRSKNENLTAEIDHLNTEMKNLNSDISTLSTELDNLNQKIKEIEESDSDEDLDKDGDEDRENLNALAYGGLGLGILGVIMALAAIAMLLKKKRPPEMPPEEREVPTTPSIPEQQVISESETTPQEQPRVTPEVQDQESVQVQQQEGLG